MSEETSDSSSPSPDKERARKPGKTIKLVVFAWFVLIFVGLMYSTTDRLVDFDPQATLLDNSTEQTFYAELDSFLKTHYESVQGRAFHISDDSCFCQMVAGSHIADVKKLVSNHTMENVSIALSELPEMEKFLPSVPAVIIYNDQSQLIYVGPYSTGYLCTTGNGLVEDLIPKMTQAVSDPVVMSLARGCYCNI